MPFHKATEMVTKMIRGNDLLLLLLNTALNSKRNSLKLNLTMICHRIAL